MKRIVLVVVLAAAACGPAGSTGSTVASTTSVPSTPATSASAPLGTATTTSIGRDTTVVSTTTTTFAELRSIAYQPVVTGFEWPIYLTARPGEPTAVLVTKPGRVWTVAGDEMSDEPILDISDQVHDEGERGMLGLALHPTDPTRIFLHYSGSGGDTVVSEFAVSPDGTIGAGSERVLLTLDQPAGNHNGGMIQFGPDGRLYLGLGDGGGAGDEYGNGQSDSLLGGLVAIDVDTGEATKFARGLRNPWRFWIDGDRIYIADVGQASYEEVDIASLAPGLNFGWPITEGLHCYSPRSGCDTEGLTMPVVEVEHGDGGTCSITGGIVYRGAAIPELDGQYFYSDYCGGWLRSLAAGSGDVVDWTDQVGVPGPVSSFGIDGDGEMYVLTVDSILRVVPVR